MYITHILSLVTPDKSSFIFYLQHILRQIPPQANCLLVFKKKTFLNLTFEECCYRASNEQQSYRKKMIKILSYLFILKTEHPYRTDIRQISLMTRKFSELPPR